MDIKKYGVVLVAVTVTALIFGAMLPAFADAAATEDKYSNTDGAQGYFIKIGPDTESYTLEYNVANIGKCTVNGTEVNTFSGSMIVIKDIGLIRCKDDGNWGIRVLEPSNISVGINTLSLEINNGVMTFSCDGGATKTITLTDVGYAIAPTGPYVMTSASQDIYVPDDYNIMAIGITYLSSTIADVFQLNGTIEDMSVACIIPPEEENNHATVDNVKVNATPINDHIGVSKLSSVTFDATLTDTPVHCTYNRIIVPAEFTAERTIHFNGAEGAIINVLPLVIGVGLVTLAVGYFIRKK